MILINRLFQTKNSWSYHVQDRLDDEAVKHNDVLFYPAPLVVSSTGNLFDSLLQYGVKSAEYLRRFKGHIDKVIFLDSMQLPYHQMECLDSNVPFEVYIRLSMDYQRYGVHSAAYFHYQKSFPFFLVHSEHTAKSYDGDKPYRVVGNPVNRFRSYMKKDIVVWAANDAENPTKDFTMFLRIAERNPRITFYACLRSSPSCALPTNVTVFQGLSSIEYLELLRKARFVLSTALCETFGNCIMDGISVGCVPLARRVGCYVDILPPKFLYDDFPDFISADKGELESIVAPYYVERVFERLCGYSN